MKPAISTLALAVAGAVLALPTHAQQARDHSSHAGHGASSAQPASGPMAAGQAALVDGEVRRIDRAAHKLTLRHGPIPSLDMTAMTMVFRVADTSMLESLKTGDKVRFAAERVGGDLTVTRIEPAR